MKNFKKMGIMLTLMCLLMTTSNQIIAYAAQGNERISQTKMTSISSYKANLEISDDGIAKVYAIVIGKSGVEYTYVKASLQKKTSSGWSEVESWETSGTSSAIVAKDYQVSSGTYRVVANFTADSENETMTTANKTY